MNDGTNRPDGMPPDEIDDLVVEDDHQGFPEIDEADMAPAPSESVEEETLPIAPSDVKTRSRRRRRRASARRAKSTPVVLDMTHWSGEESALWRLGYRPETRAAQKIENPETGEHEWHHPRYDDLYSQLDEDSRDLTEHRYTFNEALMDKQFRNMLKDLGIYNSTTGPLMGVLMTLMLCGVLAFAIFQYGQWYEGGGGIADIALGLLAALPWWSSVFVAVVACPFVYWWRMMAAYNQVMTRVYIVDGHKRVIVCDYPNYLMANRGVGDQLTTGEFVLALEPCCIDMNCAHPLRKIYERDLEFGLKSASTTGVEAAAAKYDYIRRVKHIADNAPTVPVSPREFASKLLPYGLVAIGCGIGAFLVFNSGSTGGG